MAGLWQRTGNVTVTNGSRTITGFGTKWKTGILLIQKGHTFYGPDGMANEVDTVVSDTEIVLVEAYRGGTMANQPYKIDITRTSTISQFAADLAALVGKYRSWFDGMMTWLTGSGDVSILNPDTGANTTIPSWKKVASEGEGQAARAKAEAEKAAASATLAGGVVEASALPLPDVWAPLSDNLQMITGYGRDVRVGSDVVAMMVSLSRSTIKTFIGKDGVLKTAAVNEPAFEKEGLLIEGPSVNLIPHGSLSVSAANIQGWTLSTVSGAIGNISAVTDPKYGSLVRFGQGAPRTPYVSPSIVGLEVGATYCLSAFCPYDDTGASVLRVGGVGLTHTRIGDRIFATFIADNTSVSIQVGKGVLNPVDVDKFVIMGHIQLEKLPFPSSFIPTAGAAASRSADVVTLPWALNVPVSNLSVAVNYDVFGVNPLQHQRIFEYGHNQTPRYLFQITSSGYFESFAATSGLSIGSPSLGYGAIAAASTTPNRHSVKITGRPVSSYAPTGPVMPTQSIFIGTGIGGQAPMYGHIRNLRIWHRALTDDQLKAVA